MRSTGEVMGIDQSFGTAYAKSQEAVYGSLPVKGRVFVSVANRDKRAMVFPVKRLADLGFEIWATSGTAEVLRRNGVRAKIVRKHSDGAAPGGEPTVVTRILDGEVDLIVNTPWGSLSAASAAVRLDGYEIRTAAVRRGVPVRDHRGRPGGGGAGHRGHHPRRDRRPLPAGARRRAARVRPRRRTRAKRPAERDDRVGLRLGRDGGWMAGNEREGGVAPVQVRGTVLTVRRVDAYVAMTVVAPAIATRFRPGQFIAIAVGGLQSGMLARRTFPVHDVRPDHGGTVEFVFLPREPGAQWLADCRARDVLDVVGPLGRPFPMPRDPASCLLLGVGAGAPPLFALAARLTERQSATDFLLGAESADRVFGALTARRTGRSAVITTADGSLGSRGSVVDMLPTVVQQARTDVIYASAPVPVLRSVCAMAGRYGIPVQALVSEPAMTCGTGLCMGCVLPVVGNDGITRMVRACVDGPVFRGDLVRWDDVGTIPFDALGAPGWKPRPAAGGAGPVTEGRSHVG